MTALATSLLSMIASLLPQLSGLTSANITSIISTIIGILPTVIQEIEQLGPIVSNIIAILSGNAAATPDQITALQSAQAQIDAAFTQSLAAAQAAAGQAGATGATGATGS